MKKFLFFLLFGWLLVCAFSVFEVESSGVQAVFGELFDDNKTLEIDFTPVLSFLSKLRILKKDYTFDPILLTTKELTKLIIQGIIFFVLGIILLAIFNIFSKFIFYPTIVFGGIIIFLLHYFKILTLNEMFNWIKFYWDYLALGVSALLGSLMKKLKKGI